MLSFKSYLEEAKATPCGRCGTTHVPPSKGGTCPALEKNEELEDPNHGKVKAPKRITSKRGGMLKQEAMTQDQQDKFAQSVGDRFRAKQRSDKVSSMSRKRANVKEESESLDKAKAKAKAKKNSMKEDASPGKPLSEMYRSKAAFKRREHEFEAEMDRRNDAKRKAANDKPVDHHIYADGKPFKMKGKPVIAKSRSHARNLMNKLKSHEFNKDKKFSAHYADDLPDSK